MNLNQNPMESVDETKNPATGRTTGRRLFDNQ